MSQACNASSHARPRHRYLMVALVLLALLTFAGCAVLSPLAMPVTAGSGLGLSFQADQSVQAGGSFATLTVAIRERLAAYRTAAMPYTWDTAVVTLSGGTLPATQTRTVAETTFNGSAYASAVVTGIVPGSGFSLNVKLYYGGTSGTLVAQGTDSSFSLTAGAQTITVTEGISPYLTGIDPLPSAAGNTVTIEGQDFGTSATVNFPGGSVAATLIGLGRLSAVVPSGTSIGSLSVTTGGVTTNTLAFSATPYSNGLDGFFSTPFQAGTGEGGAALVTARYAHTSALVGTSLYVLGGTTGSGALSSVEVAPLDPNGSLGLFAAASGVSLATARYGHATVQIGNYLYVIGGFDATGAPLGSIERASVSGGTLGSFSLVSGVTLATPRGYTSVAIAGPYLYVIGGYGTSALPSVERALINADGTIGTFATVSGLGLVQARSQHASVVVGSYVYVVGGTNGSPLGSIERATINPDGTLGAFSTVSGVTLSTARFGHACLVSGNGIYVIGGEGATSTFLASVEHATINADGTISTFATAGPSLNSARQGHSAVVYNGYAYVVGGQGSAALGSAEVASVNSSGKIANFVASSTTLANVTYLPGYVATPGHIYVIGGKDNLASTALACVQQASVASDGTIGAFSIPESLKTARYYPLVVRAGGYVYVMGGETASGGFIFSIEQAAIQPDGSLGPFTTLSYTLPSCHWGGAAFVAGSNLYVVAGEPGTGTTRNTTTPNGQIDVAPLNASGNMTAGFSTLSNTLPTGMETFASMLIGNTFYTLGGYSSGGAVVATVQTISLNATGGVVSTGTSGSLAAARELSSAAVIGNTAYLVGGYAGGGQVTVQQCSIGANGSLGTWANGTTSLSSGRWGAACLVVGNSVTMLGGKAVAGSSGASLNSIDAGALN